MLTCENHIVGTGLTDCLSVQLVGNCTGRYDPMNTKQTKPATLLSLCPPLGPPCPDNYHQKQTANEII